MKSPQFPRAKQIPFSDFNLKYDGRSCYVVGRGPTEFDFDQLSAVTDPVFFINDAVCLEKHVQSDSYFFLHDAQLLPWLDGKIKSTVVVPIDGKVFRHTPDITLQHAGKIVFYHWREQQREQLLYMSRDQIGRLRQLYTHTGTIHSVLHFLWFCGFTRVNFIGCDCIGGYDSRLANLSNSSPSHTYPVIRKAQDLLTMLFGFEAVYLGTPTSRF